MQRFHDFFQKKFLKHFLCTRLRATISRNFHILFLESATRKKNGNVIKLQFFLFFLGVEIDSETANVIRIFEDKPLMLTSDFDTSATDDTTDDEDDTKSMRSRQALAKRRLNLTPGLPEDTTYSMREFMHGKLILIVYKLGK